MTGRTHDLAAFTALNYIIATQPLPEMSLATAFVAFSANMIGGLAPDLDQSTSSLYKRVRAGSILGRLVSPLFGGHRFISHSIVGVFLVGFILDFLLGLIGQVLLVDMNLVWWAFMIGFVSHLVMDTFTREGVPWFFPIPWHIGIPPLKALRIKTGGLFEKSLIFPGLILINGLIIYYHYDRYLEFLRYYIK